MKQSVHPASRQRDGGVRLRQTQQKQPVVPLPMHGEVVRLDDAAGFGFVRTPEGDEYYFGHDNVVGMPFAHIQTGTAVQFIPEVAGEELHAKRVSPARHGLA
jgi:cold shock CspA family protein